MLCEINLSYVLVDPESGDEANCNKRYMLEEIDLHQVPGAIKGLIIDKHSSKNQKNIKIHVSVYSDVDDILEYEASDYAEFLKQEQII